MNSILHIEGCVDCVIDVQGKVNSITLTRCRNTVLRFDGVIASCAVFRCERVRVASRTLCSTFEVELSNDVAVTFPCAVDNVLITSSQCTGFTIVAAAPGEGDSGASTAGARWPRSHAHLGELAASVAAEAGAENDTTHQPALVDVISEVLTAEGGAGAQLYTRWNGVQFVTEIIERASMAAHVANLPH